MTNTIILEQAPRSDMATAVTVPADTQERNRKAVFDRELGVWRPTLDATHFEANEAAALEAQRPPSPTVGHRAGVRAKSAILTAYLILNLALTISNKLVLRHVCDILHHCCNSY